MRNPRIQALAFSAVLLLAAACDDATNAVAGG
jgi:hypothetical protein